VATYLLGQLRRTVVLTGDPAIEALETEVLGYPSVAQIAPLVAGAVGGDPPIVVPFRMSTPLGEVAMFTTLTTFGTPLDVTVDELALEMFFPADDRSAATLRELAGATA